MSNEMLAKMQQHINELVDQLAFVSARSETQREALNLVDAYVDYAFKATDAPESFKSWIRGNLTIPPHMVIF